MTNIKYNEMRKQKRNDCCKMVIKNWSFCKIVEPSCVHSKCTFNRKWKLFWKLIIWNGLRRLAKKWRTNFHEKLLTELIHDIQLLVNTHGNRRISYLKRPSKYTFNEIQIENNTKALQLILASKQSSLWKVL